MADLDEVSPGKMKSVEIGGDQVLLSNVEGTIYACDNLSSHAFAPLAEGDLDGRQVECPLHGSIFDVATGEVIDPPAIERLRVFQVRIEGQDILVGPPAG